jgi:2-C-methyl-D-erythritol 4-phosphate cytidylyltransferase
MANYFAIIAAAGSSTRFGGSSPKQYQVINQKTILEHSIECLLGFAPLKKLIVAIHPDDQHWQKLDDAKHPKIATTFGGATRTQSVLHGLQSLQSIAAPEDWILVHDAARPYLKQHDLFNLIEATKDHAVGGILVAPVVDTLKFSSDGKHIDRTIPRQGLYRALTPQCFRFEKLFHALMQAPETITDDAMALELAGYQSLLVEGSPANCKITYREDIA